MAYVCNSWDPRDDRYPHYRFVARYQTTATVDSDGDEDMDTEVDTEHGTVGSIEECYECGSGDVSYERYANDAHQRIAWDAGCGWCEDCLCATRNREGWECDNCGDEHRPFNEGDDEDEDEDDLPMPSLIAKTHMPLASVT